jgi:hypothetical protein
VSGIGGRAGGGPAGLAARLAAIPLRWLGVGAGVAALAVSGLFGGLNDVHRPELPTVEVKAADRGSPWNVTVLRARLISDLSPLKPATAGNHWLGVVATVEVTADESRTDLADVLRLSGVAGLTSDEPAHVVQMRDATEPVQLNPGMPEDLAFVWEQAAGTPKAAEVTLQIYGKTYRLDSIGDKMAWLDPAPRAQVVVPLEDRST